MTDKRSAWRMVMLLGISACILIFSTLGLSSLQAGRFVTSWKWQLGGLGLLGLLIGLLAGLILSWTSAWRRIEFFLEKIGAVLRRIGFLNFIVCLAALGVFLFICFQPVEGFFKEPELFNSLAARLGVLAALSTLAIPFALAAFRHNQAWQVILGTLLFFGVAYRIALFIPQLSTSPFTLGWSEASRYYYASLFFSKQIYGVELPWPFLHPSRYLLLSLPFLFDQMPLWAHRLWQVILWLGTNALAAWLLVRRLRLAPRPLATLGAASAFLFLFQGPVYYHLMICVILILAGFNPRRFTHSLWIVILASAWAGISRVNWFPVPAFLAASLYLLETPRSPSTSLWRYLSRPAAWGIAGGLVAVASQAIYILLSHQADAQAFGSSFTSDLLWYRLLPSPTYPPGILTMILLLTLPLLVLISLNVRREHMHWIRTLAMGVMLLVLFLGGLVVSTKIGGGSNLHNLDAYLVLLLIWGSYVLAERLTPEVSSARMRLPGLLVAVVFLLPLISTLNEGGPFTFKYRTIPVAELQTLQNEVHTATQEGGQVLFTWQRQLLTFGEIRGIDLIPEYETVELMEMAMSANQPYLQQFYSDLRNKRFALIVTDFQNPILKGPKDSFPEEHNVWAERISQPLMQNYQRKLLLPDSMIEVYVPIP
jgi:hypothetical protein